MGMSVVGDDGKGYCQLQYGEAHGVGARARSFIGVRTRAADAPAGRFDHVAFSIDDWNTDRVKGELERRGLKPRLQPGGAGDTPNYVSFHVEDPDGVGIQISGIARRGDSLYKG
jgi:catechol 2,3-dioxygenase-like lactoylglutathione lyase family enzyme